MFKRIKFLAICVMFGLPSIGHSQKIQNAQPLQAPSPVHHPKDYFYLLEQTRLEFGDQTDAVAKAIHHRPDYAHHVRIGDVVVFVPDHRSDVIRFAHQPLKPIEGLALGKKWESPGRYKNPVIDPRAIKPQYMPVISGNFEVIAYAQGYLAFRTPQDPKGFRFIDLNRYGEFSLDSQVPIYWCPEESLWDLVDDKRSNSVITQLRILSEANDLIFRMVSNLTDPEFFKIITPDIKRLYVAYEEGETTLHPSDAIQISRSKSPTRITVGPGFIDPAASQIIPQETANPIHTTFLETQQKKQKSWMKFHHTLKKITTYLFAPKTDGARSIRQALTSLVSPKNLARRALKVIHTPAGLSTAVIFPATGIAASVAMSQHPQTAELVESVLKPFLSESLEIGHLAISTIGNRLGELRQIGTAAALQFGGLATKGVSNYVDGDNAIKLGIGMSWMFVSMAGSYAAMHCVVNFTQLAVQLYQTGIPLPKWVNQRELQHLEEQARAESPDQFDEKTWRDLAAQVQEINPPRNLKTYAFALKNLIFSSVAFFETVKFAASFWNYVVFPVRSFLFDPLNRLPIYISRPELFLKALSNEKHFVVPTEANGGQRHLIESISVLLKDHETQKKLREQEDAIIESEIARYAGIAQSSWDLLTERYPKANAIRQTLGYPTTFNDPRAKKLPKKAEVLYYSLFYETLNAPERSSEEIWAAAERRTRHFWERIKLRTLSRLDKTKSGDIRRLALGHQGLRQPGLVKRVAANELSRFVTDVPQELFYLFVISAGARLGTELAPIQVQEFSATSWHYLSIAIFKAWMVGQSVSFFTDPWAAFQYLGRQKEYFNHRPSDPNISFLKWFWIQGLNHPDNSFLENWKIMIELTRSNLKSALILTLAVHFATFGRFDLDVYLMNLVIMWGIPLGAVVMKVSNAFERSSGWFLRDVDVNDPEAMKKALSAREKARVLFNAYFRFLWENPTFFFQRTLAYIEVASIGPRSLARTLFGNTPTVWAHHAFDGVRAILPLDLEPSIDTCERWLTRKYPADPEGVISPHLKRP